MAYSVLDIFHTVHKTRFSTRSKLTTAMLGFNNNNLFNIHVLFKNTTDLQPNTVCCRH